MTATPEKITVKLGARSYDILIGQGLLANIGTVLTPLLTRPKVVIVTDDNLAKLHLATLHDGLDQSAISHDTIILPAGEKTKNFAQLETLLDQLIGLEVDRADMILGFGGGVIGDITGFAAAILRRGCRFIQIPTTLLAQVDSSVGGKTAINATAGKNLIGAFHQPSLVIADIDLLDTLPKRELLAGYAEVVKYGLIGDAEFFGWLDQNGAQLMAGDKSLRTQAVSHSCAAKADIVAEDETETGRRALLNFGHTFGHALEAATGFSDKLLHGEAVAVGMAMAFDLCAENGTCPAQDASHVRSHLDTIGLPSSISHIDGLETTSDFLLRAMYQDKKTSGGKLTLILPNTIGDAYIAKNVDASPILEFLNRHLAALH